jgi:hypothetical protein
MKKMSITMLTIAFTFCQHAMAQQEKSFETPYIKGSFVHIFNPNDTRSKEDTTWYTNDHSFVRGVDGIWHAYGIIGHHPIRPWGGETRFFHITSGSLMQRKWKDRGCHVREGR